MPIWRQGGTWESCTCEFWLKVFCLFFFLDTITVRLRHRWLSVCTPWAAMRSPWATLSGSGLLVAWWTCLKLWPERCQSALWQCTAMTPTARLWLTSSSPCRYCSRLTFYLEISGIKSPVKWRHSFIFVVFLDGYQRGGLVCSRTGGLSVRSGGFWKRCDRRRCLHAARTWNSDGKKKLIIDHF